MKLHFILNAAARTGSASSVWNALKIRLTDEKISYKIHPTAYPGAASDLARELSELPEEKVWVVVIGGDGTFNEFLNGITDFEKLRVGLIPAGSGNDFARGAGLKSGMEGFDAILQSVHQEEQGHPVSRIDLGEAVYEGNRRLFGISAGIGLDAIVCKKALTSPVKKVLNRIHLGKLTYILLTVASLFSMETTGASLVFSDGSRLSVRKMIFAAGMNLFAEGGGVPMAPNADPADGRLALTVAHGIPKAVTFLKLPFLIAAKQEKVKGFSIYEDREFTVCTDRAFTLHTDGEYCGEVRKVTFRCLESRLQLLGTSR